MYINQQAVNKLLATALVVGTLLSLFLCPLIVCVIIANHNLQMMSLCVCVCVCVRERERERGTLHPSSKYP